MPSKFTNLREAAIKPNGINYEIASRGWDDDRMWDDDDARHPKDCCQVCGELLCIACGTCIYEGECKCLCDVEVEL